jgi:hypothetical protein
VSRVSWEPNPVFSSGAMVEYWPLQSPRWLRDIPSAKCENQLDIPNQTEFLPHQSYSSQKIMPFFPLLRPITLKLSFAHPLLFLPMCSIPASPGASAFETALPHIPSAWHGWSYPQPPWLSPWWQSHPDWLPAPIHDWATHQHTRKSEPATSHLIQNKGQVLIKAFSCDVTFAVMLSPPGTC